MSTEVLAALDVGSNSIRLSVAEYDDKGLRIVDEVKDQPRLAAGLAATGALDPAAMERAVEALKRMRGVVERRGVTRLRAVATSAVREADNGRAFVARIKKETGFDLEVIDEHTEATLSYRSVAHHFALQDTRALVIDIGGGSLELVGAINGLVEVSASLPMGAVRLTEMFLQGERPIPREVRSLRKSVRQQLKRAFQVKEWRGAVVIGSGGTFTNLGRMVRARRGADVGMVHGEVVVAGEVEQLLEWLSTKSSAERAGVPGLNPQRADIILAGLATTAELLDQVEARSVTVSAYGLREGILLEMVGGSATIAADPFRAMRELVDRCMGDRRHVEQVRVLALTLFDRLKDALGALEGERFLLEAAALLHDVGQVVSYRRHHKHSYQLIMHADRLSLGTRERELVALISRYHRKKGPSKKHPEFAALAPADREVVRRLAGLLRVADGLDRGHATAVERLTTRLTADSLSIRVAPRDPRADLSLEIWGALRKADVLEKLLDRRVLIGASKS
ncbi:MAG: HD domain-containing protein [Gemmatimonadales bacterium]